MDDPNTLLPNGPVERRWENVLKVRREFAVELDQVASQLPGDNRKHMRKLSDWFEGPAKLEDALKRSDVLAILLPLMSGEGKTEDALSPADLKQAARLGICTMGRGAAGGQKLIWRIIPTFLILFVAFMIAVAMSFLVLPPFEKIFEEFGFSMPLLTSMVLGFAGFLRSYWWILISVPVVGFLMLCVANWFGRNARPANLSWFDHFTMSTRSALASWAWHVSLLLEMGVSQPQAVEAAGQASGNSWLRTVSFKWADTFDPEAEQNDPVPFYSPKFRLLNNVMQMPPSKTKIEMLREVAIYYWDRNHNLGGWFIYLFNRMLISVIGLGIGIAVFSLFLPLMSMIGGLI